MRVLSLALAMTLASCSPLMEAPVPSEPVIEVAPAPVVTMPCPAGTRASDDGIGGTGCK